MKVGEISYTNILPMFFYLDRELLGRKGITLTSAVPSKINLMMEEEQVDLAGISSFSFGKNASNYRLLPDLSVSSFGPVNSIFLFSKCPIDELIGKKIALTSSSETSVALLKVILHHFYSIQVEYQVETPDFSLMMENYDACLLIGDDAIKAKRQSGDYFVYDLGEIWYQHTGLPMVYAVVAYRKDLEKSNENQLTYLWESMVNSKMRCKEESFSAVVDHVVSEHGGSHAFWQSYFNGLNYQFTGEHERGLDLYFQLAKECGLIQQKPSILTFSYK
jgi:chorismate dehydratase